MALVKIAGRVRGLFAGNYPENREDEQFHINTRGDTVLAQALPERSELVRLGQSYICIGTTQLATASFPSTTATCSTGHLSLWNGELDGGKSYSIDFIGMHVFAGAAAIVQLQMGGQLNLGRQASPAGALTIKSLNGRASYQGKGNAAAGFAVAYDQAWHPIGTSLVSGNATANVTLNIEQMVQGRYLVPPGGIFSLLGLTNTTSSGPVVKPYIVFHEVQVPVV